MEIMARTVLEQVRLQERPQEAECTAITTEQEATATSIRTATMELSLDSNRQEELSLSSHLARTLLPDSSSCRTSTMISFRTSGRTLETSSKGEWNRRRMRGGGVCGSVKVMVVI